MPERDREKQDPTRREPEPDPIDRFNKRPGRKDPIDLNEFEQVEEDALEQEEKEGE